MRQKMVTSLLALLLVLAGCSQLSAQKRIPREVHLGVIGGANLSEYTLYPRVTQKLTQGYTGGVAVRYIEETLFGLQAELLLTQRGFTDYYEQHQDWQFSRTLTYVEVPVMAHIYFKVGDKHEVIVDMGPKLGFYLSDNVMDQMPADFGQIGSETETYTSEHHSLAVTKKFDYGIQAGLGYEFKFSDKMSMQLQGRYYYGLGNIWPDTKADIFEQSSNQSIQIVMSLWWRHTIRGKKVKNKATN